MTERELPEERFIGNIEFSLEDGSVLLLHNEKHTARLSWKTKLSPQEFLQKIDGLFYEEREVPTTVIVSTQTKHRPGKIPLGLKPGIWDYEYGSDYNLPENIEELQVILFNQDVLLWEKGESNRIGIEPDMGKFGYGVPFSYFYRETTGNQLPDDVMKKVMQVTNPREFDDNGFRL